MSVGNLLLSSGFAVRCGCNLVWRHSTLVSDVQIGGLEDDWSLWSDAVSVDPDADSVDYPYLNGSIGALSASRAQPGIPLITLAPTGGCQERGQPLLNSCESRETASQQAVQYSNGTKTA